MKKASISCAAGVGAWLACFVLGLIWSASACVEDARVSAVAAQSASAQRIRLPAVKLGGIRSGHVLMITERGMENVQFTLLAQYQTRKPSLLSEFCLVH